MVGNIASDEKHPLAAGDNLIEWIEHWICDLG